MSRRILGALLVMVGVLASGGAANYVGVCLTEARVLNPKEKIQAASSFASIGLAGARSEVEQSGHFGWFVRDPTGMDKIDRLLGRLSGYAVVHMIERQDAEIAHIASPLEKAMGVPYDSRVILAVSNCGRAWDSLDLYPQLRLRSQRQVTADIPAPGALGRRLALIEPER